MPVVLNIEKSDFHLKVWYITEAYAFFEENTLLFPAEKEILDQIPRQQRRLQWLASRFLTKQMCHHSEIVKNEHGKPFLKSSDTFISISHCEKYAVCITSDKYNVGVDIEPMREKVVRLADKFMDENEMAFIEKENAIKHYITCWAMKEAAYKWYGQEYISFKDNIKIAPFTYNDQLSRIPVKVYAPNNTYALKAFHLNLDEHSLVFCFAKKDLQNQDW